MTASAASCVYWISGAGGGIGRALCAHWLAAGDAVFATDLRDEALQALAAEVPEAQRERLTTRVLDVTDADAVTAAIREARSRFGRLDAVVNNAGLYSSGRFAEADLATWTHVFNVNALGVAHGCRAAVDIMREQGFGQIVNVASTAGVTPVLNASAYAAAKHAVVGLTRSLREELRGSGIDVHLVIPGLIDTGIFDRARDDGLNSRTLIDAVPLRKWPPEKAAWAIADGLRAGRADIVFPLSNRLLVNLYRWWPGLATRLIAANQRH